jgi:hypothetical protein
MILSEAESGLFGAGRVAVTISRESCHRKELAILVWEQLVRASMTTVFVPPLGVWPDIDAGTKRTATAVGC